MAKARDPVCGMIVEINVSTLHTNFEGSEYYFCSPSCKTKFEEELSQNQENNNG